ncbi:hypothetical protein BCR22_07300 [Enterococcus plantarum]|uniref:hypothetical protein n=1 Tax=Enterococcus plantarum TaxID=1077675 RepID=UPI00084D06A3|nr:hypothetical protein [Enterococcus plantarum]OEG09392.1 hypothetical protein BCR22_07300 [Enterococcus plantarum]
MIKKGEKVKYIGTGVRKYTGQLLEVKSVGKNCVILYFPKADRHQVAIENGGIWKQDSLLCRHSEVVEV